MSEAEHTCRICRGEATAAQPLLHPCKCRGSIKYIHQDCLMEWLEHSNNKNKSCDICNTPYQFRTIYDPDMPKTMPAREIYRKLMIQSGRWIVRRISMLLYVVCMCQVPIFWKFVGRLFTYAVDGKMPSPEFSIFHVMAYGAYSRTSNDLPLDGPDTTFMDRFLTFFINTYLIGVFQVLAFVLVLFVIFVEHEWVVREEGYTKSLLRQIGKEPKTKLVDLLSSMTQSSTGEEEGPRESMTHRAIEYLQEEHYIADQDNLRQALENGQFDDLFRERLDHSNTSDGISPQRNNSTRNEAGAETGFSHQGVPDESDELFPNSRGGSEADLIPNEAASVQHLRDVDDSLLETRPFEQVGIDLNEQLVNNNAADVSDEEETEEELERRRNLAEDEIAAAEAANNNGNILELLGFRFNIATPMQLMLLADLVNLLFLFNAYLVPHMLGSFVALVLSFVFIGLKDAFIVPLLHLLPTEKISALTSNFFLAAENRIPIFISLRYIIAEYFVLPLSSLVEDISTVDRAVPYTSFERFIFLAIGYSVICFAINQLMSALVIGRRPVMGTSRKMYKILFQITATAKVFSIFAIEIVFFPIYCGWLLDFCAAPLFINDLIVKTDAGVSYNLFYTSAHAFTASPYVRFFSYWSFGTSYMFCIALFVSMIRNHILRPGVLYFIKSPEDPNARLIHDAVVKPFFLQMSRIFLSGKVYSAFIVFGIGSVTWGLRFLVNAPGSNGSFLPIQNPSFIGIKLIIFTLFVLIKSKVVIAKYCRVFWTRSFQIICHKLRLSHFILGSPVPQERGYILYRNFFHRLLKVASPDYTKPMSYSEAIKTFDEDSSVNACFVPDGSYIRAPSSDDNSRKFLRELFVPVTKSDQLLAPIEDNGDSEDTDWWDADVVYEDSYTVVYSPPNNKTRYLGLVCMVCIFGALLIVSILLAAIILGRPVLRAALIVVDHYFASLHIAYRPPTKFNWKFADHGSICLGLLAELGILLAIDYKPDASTVANFAARQRARLIRPVGNVSALLPRILLSATWSSLQTWFAADIHLTYLNTVEEYFLGTSILDANSSDLSTKAYFVGIGMHLAMAVWTVVPLFAPINVGYPQMGRSAMTWVKKIGFINLLTSIGLITIHKLYIMVEKHAGRTLAAQKKAYLSLGVLIAIFVTRSTMKVYGLLEGINEQIKTEKYVRGTALENVDLEED